MANEELCDPCRSFLRGLSLYDRKTRTFTHHASATSFQHALDLPCAICVRLWAAFNRAYEHTIDDVPCVAPTTYSWPSLRKKDLATRSRLVPFTCGRHHAQLVMQPCEDESDDIGQVEAANTGDDAALNFFVKQYRECRDTHEQCRLSTSGSHYLPTRVIDVGKPGDELVCLCEAEHLDVSSPYIALSHCWGRSQPFTLTRASYAELKSGVSTSVLPRTFQDAIIATRKLGVRYIWIDSICIFQDSLDDWHAEAGKMWDVYRKATCCIAATAAKDGNTGLFFDRDPRGVTPITVEVTWNHVQPHPRFPPPGMYHCGVHWITSYSAIDEAPLNQRGWVAQERYLSPRLLHFSWDVLFWECYESLTSETYPKGIPDLGYTGEGNYNTRRLKLLVADIQRSQKLQGLSTTTSLGGELPIESGEAASTAIHRAWCTFRTAYTQYGMTYAKDRLPALSGIAHDVALATHDSLIAGLWKSHFIAELCWTHNGMDIFRNPRLESRMETWHAPSWSWASSKLYVVPGPGMGDMAEYEEVRECVVVKKFDVRALPSGELQHASVVMECCPIEVQMKEVRGEWMGRVPVVSGGDENVIDVQLDASSEGHQRDVWLIVLRHWINDATTSAHVEGLVIGRSPDHALCFVRVGIIRLHHNAEGLPYSGIPWLLEQHGRIEHRALELV